MNLVFEKKKIENQIVLRAEICVTSLFHVKKISTKNKEFVEVTLPQRSNICNIPVIY